MNHGLIKIEKGERIVATKGPSSRYSNGCATDKKKRKTIGFDWAKDFNRNGIEGHSRDHGGSFGTPNKEEYRAKAIRFANTIDKENCESFVDERGSTHKFNKKTNEYIIIDKKGYIVTYHILSGGKKSFDRHKQTKKKGQNKK